MQHGRSVLSRVMLLSLPMIYGAAVHAATPVDLGKLNASYLQPYLTNSAAAGQVQLQKGRQTVDMKKTLHVRFQQLYMGYPVLGGEAIVHVPHGKATSLAGMAASSNTLDGTFYQGLQADLANAPAVIFTSQQSQKALQTAISNREHKAGGQLTVSDQQSKLVVFVDDNNKAHWAYAVSFLVPAKAGQLPSHPTVIMDAVSMQVYAEWDDVKTIGSLETGGGFGGNLKMGKLVYDGAQGDLANYPLTRDTNKQVCFMKNNDVTVKNYDTDAVIQFSCVTADADHNMVYWAGEQDAVNGGYSPADDAMFGGMVIKNMYHDWYGFPVLTDEDGKPLMLNMIVHDHIDNAYWYNHQMTFGDGVSMFYPLTSLGVAAHEISHGFTEQHSNLTYRRQSGGMNESFSDMAAQAAEIYAYGKNSWQIGPEIFKRENEALRYMDKPSKDCHGKPPGNWCSIDKASQYTEGLDVHYSSGVYNRFFYLLSTTKDWTVKKAFDVMVQANANYWTSSTDFKTGACGVLKANKDLGYDETAVRRAFKKVGISTSECTAVDG